MISQVKRGFARLMGVGNQPGDPVNHKMGDTAMARVFNLGYIFELIIDRLNERTLAQQALIKQRQEAIVPVLTKGGDQVKASVKEVLK